MKDNQVDLFTVPVWGFILNEQKYQSSDYLDHIKKLEQTAPSEKKSNFGGYQTHDNLHQAPVFKEFISSLETIASKIIQSSCVVKEMWGNINYQHHFNGAHTHGGTLSGVFYIKTPTDCGRLILVNPAVRGDGKPFRGGNFSINPEPLACIMFPSWLEHYVEPNLSSEPRVSISFNIENKI